MAILAGYWALMTFVPMSGIGVGSYAKNANLANWIDAQYLPGRKWNGAGSFVDSHLTPGAGSFLAHAVGLLLAVALAGLLYRRKIFLRV